MYPYDPASLLDAHRVEHRLLVDEAAARARSPQRGAADRLRDRTRHAYIHLLQRALTRARAAQARSGPAGPAGIA